MIKEIGIGKYKGIASLELYKLGKINVLCGKNNSGKTSIIKALLERGKIVRRLDLAPNQNDLRRNIEKYNLKPSLNKNEIISDRLVKIIDENLIEFLATRKQELSWKNIPSILGNFRSYLANLNIKLTDGENSNCVKIIWFLFKRYSFHLIQPKRKQCTYAKPDKFNVFEFEDYGLINSLFYVQNADPESDYATRFKRLKLDFKYVSNGADFQLVLNTSNEIRIHFKNESSRWFNSENSGMGFNDLLVMLTAIHFSEDRFFLFEEPENHLHPEMQRRLLHVFEKCHEAQFLLSTHSSIFLDATMVDQIYLTKYTKLKGVEAESGMSRAHILSSIGYSVADNLISDLIILVEGPNDVVALNMLLYKFGVSTDYNIKIWALGGDIMHKQDLSVFTQKYKTIALVDKDPGSAKSRTKFESLCADVDIDVHRLERYSIENYYSVRVLKIVFKGQFPENISKLSETIKLEKQIGFDVKKRTRNIIKEMTLNEFEGTDLFDFMETIKKYLQNNNASLRLNE